MIRTTILATAALLALQTAAHADGDAVAGKKVFSRCAACHVVDKPVNRVGPSLLAVIGRPAASLPDFKYSNAMKAKAAEGLVWDEANLTAYLSDPKGLVPGGSMAFAGLKKPEDVANVIAYLQSIPTP